MAYALKIMKKHLKLLQLFIEYFNESHNTVIFYFFEILNEKKRRTITYKLMELNLPHNRYKFVYHVNFVDFRPTTFEYNFQSQNIKKLPVN